MNAKITIEDRENKYKEIINIDDLEDKNCFSYVDSYNAKNNLRVLSDGIIINRKVETHDTYVVLRDDGYIKIKTNEGTLKFSLKVIELIINNDIISIVYCVNDSIKSIKIEFLGV